MKILTYQLGPLSTNCHVVINDKNEAVCFDIGGDSGYLKLKEIQDNFIVKAVFLTHGHFDHILGVSDFCKGNIPVYIGENESDFISDSSLNLSKTFGENCKGFNFNKLKDGEIVNICNFKVEVINTPGHTKGSVSYKIDNNIFCGDLLFKDSFGRIDFPTGNAKELIKSAKFILSMSGCTLYSGHGENTTTDEEKESNPINYYD